MRIGIIDSLNETFDGPIVRGGLQKSSKMDARGFSKVGYDTTYFYCGEMTDPEYDYTHIQAGTIGAKDSAKFANKDPKRCSFVYLRKSIDRIKYELAKMDYLIVHCHSTTIMNAVNSVVKDKKIMFVVHDVIDLTWAIGFTSAVRRVRASQRNQCVFVTNSNWSVNNLNYIYSRRKTYDVLSGDEGFDAYIEHFIWTDEIVREEDIITKHNRSAVVGRYEPGKYHHKLYGYKNKDNPIIHYGIKDERRDPGLRYYNKLKEKANGFEEALSDKDLFDRIKTSKTIILPCWHEGFGFTAFEAGIYGVVSVIAMKSFELRIKEVTHATDEYLTRCGAFHLTADFRNDDDIHRVIDDSLTVTDATRMSISENLLKYFTLENYVNDRLKLIEAGPKNKIDYGMNLNQFLEDS